MRSYNRFVTDHTVGLNTGTGKCTGALYNLSSGGCMVQLDDVETRQGDPLTVTLETGLHCAGVVAWRIDNNAGVKFDHPLHAAVVQKFGFDQEQVFDRDDPRDRFGIPLVETRATAAGHMDYQLGSSV